MAWNKSLLGAGLLCAIWLPAVDGFFSTSGVVWHGSLRAFRPAACSVLVPSVWSKCFCGRGKAGDRQVRIRILFCWIDVFACLVMQHVVGVCSMLYATASLHTRTCVFWCVLLVQKAGSKITGVAARLWNIHRGTHCVSLRSIGRCKLASRGLVAPGSHAGLASFGIFSLCKEHVPD
jgi:hypothetical protein